MISIILPGIRKENWEKHYQSIYDSTKRTFELILVGPYEPSDLLLSQPNFKYIKDFGSPVRAQQIAASFATGKYITWSADDGFFVENALDEAIDSLESKEEKNNVVVMNYFENSSLVDDNVLFLNNAYPKSPYIPNDWLIFNVAIMHRKYFIELGGYDCEFECTAVSHADLAVRAQRAEAKVTLINKPMLLCGWMEGISGDHAPVHYAYEFDLNRYRTKYSSPDCVDREFIDFDNWKLALPVWERRFKK